MIKWEKNKITTKTNYMLLTKSNEINVIDCDEVKRILGVSDLRTFMSTENFPKPFFNEDKLVFDKELINKYFNVDNIDEPFLSIEDAANYLELTVPRLAHLALRSRIPSYRLKHVKGSGYLFRKSELEKFREVKISGDTEFANYYIANQLVKDMLFLFLQKFYAVSPEDRGFEIMSKYLFDSATLEDIGQYYDISRERVRQIVQENVNKIKHYDFCNEQDYMSLQKKVAQQELEITHLRKVSGVGSLNEEANKIIDIFSSLLSTKLLDCDLSVRATNSLYNGNIITVYDLLPSCRKNFLGLKKLKNMGKTTINELREFIKEKDKNLMSKVGFGLQEFIDDNPATNLQNLVFKLLNDKFSHDSK